MITNPIKSITKEINKSKNLGFDYVEIGIEPPTDAFAIRKDKSPIIKSLKNLSNPAIAHTAWWYDLSSSYKGVREAWINQANADISIANELEIKLLNFHFLIPSGILLKNQKGVETADPKIVQSTLNVHHLTYDMAMEAGNLQFEAIRFAKEKRIPIEITYVQDPEIKTTIDDSREDLSTNARIKLVTGIKDCAFFEVKGIRDKPGSELEVTSLFTKYGINKLTDIDNRNSVGFVVNSGLENLPSVKSVLEKSGHEVSIDPCSLAMVVGNLRHEDVQKFEQTAWNLSEQLASASWIRGSIISSMPIQREKYEDIIRHLHYHLIAQIV